MRVQFRKKRKCIFPAIGLLFSVSLLSWFVLNHLFPLPKEKLFKSSSAFVYSREGRLLRAFTSKDKFWRRSVKLEEIPDLMIESVLTCEDRWFYYHPGFNPISIVSAMLDNIRAGRVVRGGSTITMQIARMMEPRKRTVPSKIIELFRAVQLELTYSKKELLEIYFNMVAYGGNIEGIAAASLFYFDKSPDRLSVSEIAVLAAIPVRPAEFRPDISPEKCRHRRNQVLKKMYGRGLISREEYVGAGEEEIPWRRIDLPFIAPHFSRSMVMLYPGSCIINSTIDIKIQEICERLACRHHSRLAKKNINNLSAVVIDNESGELLALVGSPDFNDMPHDGQVNGALAPRSPGSALKPFIYALAFEQGLISPQLKVEDIPINYGGYAPVNYDKEYHGIVSVTEALINSFNIPPVNLTSRVGLKKFHDFLKSGGITSLTGNYYDYGLPLILGSGEVKLMELTNLYSLFAGGGVYKNIKITAGQDASPGRRLLSEETCYLISDILSGLARPDLPTCWEFTPDMPKIAWKTGTSYGRRDAWAIGYNPIFTVGVWAGNFSGEGSVDIVGAEIAAPLMFDIFNEIMAGREHVWFDVPRGLAVRGVSVISGRPPNEYGGETIKEYYIPGVSPSRKCDVLKKIYVDVQTGCRLTKDCLYGREYKEVVVQDWPPRLATWLVQRGAVEPLPPFDMSCRSPVDTDAPVIVSPENGTRYVLVDCIPREYQRISFEASSFSGGGEIHWFLDNRHHASSVSGEKVFYSPERGEHVLMCVDEQGHSSSLTFVIK